VAPADIAETEHLAGIDEPLVAALNVAVAKARAAAAGRQAEHEIILAADTVVVAHGRVLGKPANADAAREMLRGLRARPHRVVTGLALHAADGREWGGGVSSQIWMRAYGDAEIDAYVARGEPFDKAGGYAIQDAEFRPAERQTGCYLNVVGLPVCAVAAGLEALGVEIARPANLRPPCAYCGRGAPLVAIPPGVA
jgi:MAF protein